MVEEPEEAPNILTGTYTNHFPHFTVPDGADLNGGWADDVGKFQELPKPPSSPPPR